MILISSLFEARLRTPFALGRLIVSRDFPLMATILSPILILPSLPTAPVLDTFLTLMRPVLSSEVRLIPDMCVCVCVRVCVCM